jgi:hypothetical protein
MPAYAGMTNCDTVSQGRGGIFDFFAISSEFRIQEKRGVIFYSGFWLLIPEFIF